MKWREERKKKKGEWKKKKHKHHGGEGVLLLLSLQVPWDGLTHQWMGAWTAWGGDNKIQLNPVGLAPEPAVVFTCYTFDQNKRALWDKWGLNPWPTYYPRWLWVSWTHVHQRIWLTIKSRARASRYSCNWHCISGSSSYQFVKVLVPYEAHRWMSCISKKKKKDFCHQRLSCNSSS